MILNEYEIERNLHRFRCHPVLGPAAEVLANLMYWTNANSDGWPYWPAPSKASKDLQELFRLLGNPEADEDSVTLAEVRGAYVPIKRFLSKRGVDHAVVFGPSPVRVLHVIINEELRRLARLLRALRRTYR